MNQDMRFIRLTLPIQKSFSALFISFGQHLLQLLLTSLPITFQELEEQEQEGSFEES